MRILNSFLKVVVGFASGIIVTLLVGNAWISCVILLAAAFATQVAYARHLNNVTGGVDLVAELRVKSLAELRSVVKVPMSVTVLDILAKSLGVGALTSALIGFDVVSVP